MAFPSIGSVTGGDGAKWSSDLFIHNPHGVPVAYRLRFVTSDSVDERRFSVPPRESRRIDDIAGTFFGTSGRLGALWIIYDQTYPPVARAVTTREPGSGRGSHAIPLRPEDAAGEEAPPALIIAGYERHGNERVNLSLVNFGSGPARVTVSLLDGRGEPVGNTYHAAVAEENAFLIVDLVTALAAEPPPESTVRIEVGSGLVAARISIVDPSTGSADLLTAVPVE